MGRLMLEVRGGCREQGKHWVAVVSRGRRGERLCEMFVALHRC